MFSENEKISVRQLKRNQWLLLLNMGILLVPLYENEGSVTCWISGNFVIDSLCIVEYMGGSSGGELLASLPGRIYFWIVGTMIRRMDWDSHSALFADRDSPGGDSWMVLSVLVLQSL